MVKIFCSWIFDVGLYGGRLFEDGLFGGWIFIELLFIDIDWIVLLFWILFVSRIAFMLWFSKAFQYVMIWILFWFI